MHQISCLARLLPVGNVYLKVKSSGSWKIVFAALYTWLYMASRRTAMRRCPTELHFYGNEKSKGPSITSAYYAVAFVKCNYD